MKHILIILVILSLTTPAFCELTQTDLDKIQKIVEASETRMKEYVDIKFDAVDKQFASMDKRITDSRNLTYALIAFIGVVIGIPIWRDRKDRKFEKQIEIQVATLTQEVEALKNQQMPTP